MKKIESNLLEDLVYAIINNRKEREPVELPLETELPDDIQKLEDVKRARYEALLDKYKD